jgi:hypothetical protein
MDNTDSFDDLLAMSMESHDTAVKSMQAQLFRGWFTPPATTRYRFHNSCDDHCDLRLGNTPDQETDVLNYLTLITGLNTIEFHTFSMVVKQEFQNGFLSRLEESITLKQLILMGGEVIISQQVLKLSKQC